MSVSISITMDEMLKVLRHVYKYTPYAFYRNTINGVRKL